MNPHDYVQLRRDQLLREAEHERLLRQLRTPGRLSARSAARWLSRIVGFFL